MRIKNDKPQNGTASRLSSGERVGAVMAYVLAVTLSVMCVLVAFYAENGYNQIGNAKFSVYKVTMLAGFVPFLLLGAVTISGIKAVCHRRLCACLSAFFDDCRFFRGLL